MTPLAVPGDAEHLTRIMKEAVNYRGFCLVDILQPCITFNKVNTFEWYRQRVYRINAGYNPEDRVAAFQKALEWGDRIPIGIIYKNSRPILEDRIPVIQNQPLVKQPFDLSKMEETLKEFY